MKIKLAILYGFVTWFLIYLISTTFSPIISDNIPYINLIVPMAIIIVTGIFGILYIRNIDENEVVEGILLGIIFIIIDMLCDMIFFIIPNYRVPMLENYNVHLISMIFITLGITTFLGYLAYMTIDLK